MSCFEDKKKQINIPSLTVQLIGKTQLDKSTEIQINPKRQWHCNWMEQGTYYFPFEFLLDGNVPQSFSHHIANVSYFLQIEIINPGSTFKVQTCRTLLTVVKCQVYPEVEDSIAFGNWRNLLIYRMSVNNKTIYLGDFIRINLKFIPLHYDRYKIHRVKITLVQHTQRERKVHKDKVPLYNREPPGNDLELKLPIETGYIKFKKNNVLLYPSITLSNTDGVLEISHKVEISLLVEEISCSQKSPLSSICSESTKSSQSIDDDWTMSNASMIDEAGTLRNKRIQLTMSTKLQVLRHESHLGIEPPPSYNYTLKFPPDYSMGC
ncbi:hypothetical protein KL937_004698 [Ogataea polymorpha]|nr:hypothetical protein KL937_004698 [Ogataea polymorpha]KAG7932030.1 hypothetical protein KL904_004778 [Ogataea polymorpha]